MKILFILISFFVSCDLCAQDKIVFTGKPDTVFCKIKSVTASAIFYIEKGEHKSDYIKNVSYQSIIQNGTARTENEKIEIANAFMAQNIKKLNKAELREQLYVLITKIFSLKNENVNLEKSKSELSLSLSLLKQDIASLNVLIEKNEIENAKLNKTILTLKDTLASIRSAQEVRVKETDVTRQGLKGKVKFINGNLPLYCGVWGQPKYANKYDEKGNSIESITYNLDEKREDKTSYKYNEKGNLIQKNNYYNSIDGKSEGITTYMYNEKGNQIESNLYNGVGKSEGKTTNKYDEKGRMIEENYYNADGSLSWKLTYKYDEKGNMIEENDYRANGSLDHKYTYKYDDKGKLIEENSLIYDDKGNLIVECVYGKDDPINYKYIYGYDKKGNRIESNSYNGVGKLESKTTNKYNEKGNQIESNSYNGVGKLESKRTTKYDEKGNLVEENVYDGSGKLDRKTNTEYDSEGNWIKIIITSRLETTNIEERIIEYYK